MSIATDALMEALESFVDEKLSERDAVTADNVDGLDDFVEDKLNNIGFDDIRGLDDAVNDAAEESVNEMSIDADNVKGLDDFVDARLEVQNIQGLAEFVDNAIDAKADDLVEALQTPKGQAVLETAIRKVFASMFMKFLN